MFLSYLSREAELRIYVFQVMQSQMIGMQSSLDRILTAVQTQSGAPQSQQPPYSNNMASSPRRDSAGYAIPSSVMRNGFDSNHDDDQSRPRDFPPLPGFAPPVSKINYRIFRSSAHLLKAS